MLRVTITVKGKPYYIYINPTSIALSALHKNEEEYYPGHCQYISQISFDIQWFDMLVQHGVTYIETMSKW